MRTIFNKRANLYIKEWPDGWNIEQRDWGIRIFFAKSRYNLCYALKGRAPEDVLTDYNKFIQGQQLAPEKVAWFDPHPEDQTIKKITSPIRKCETFEGVFGFREGSSPEEEFTNVMWTDENITLGIHTADCIPLVFISEGKVCICHLYWWHVFDGFLQKIIDNCIANGFVNMQAVIGPFYRKAMKRNIFDIGEKTFFISDNLYSILGKNHILFKDIKVDTEDNPDLWSYVGDQGSNGNQATIVTML